MRAVLHRPEVIAPTGMVATPHYLASAAGLRVLRAGGNAIEAAIAASAVCAVVYPHMCGLGGDSVWLLYDARQKQVRALNGTGWAGERCTLAFYQQATGGEAIPPRGFLAANTVPGAVDAWEKAYTYGRRHFAASLPWPALFEEAIAYADGGYPVTASQFHWTWRDTQEAANPLGSLQRFAGFRQTYLKPDGTPYRAGERLRQPALARTLRTLAAAGARVFYEGELAERLVRDLEAHGGVLTRDDFRHYHATWVAPLRSTYRGYTVYGVPPNTQGLATLLLLNLLAHVDVAALGEGTADYYHLMVEATKLAFADRDRWVADPAFAAIPLATLLDPAYAGRRLRQLDWQRAAPPPTPGPAAGDTVAIVSADAQGNGVAMLQSLYFDFGSGIVAGDTGVLLHNRGSFFSLDPHHPNCLAPRKRPFHTLCPGLLCRGDRLFLLHATMGGEGQPQTQAALVTRLVDFGLPLQAAIEAPRWLYGRTWGMATRDLSLEARVPEAVVQELQRRGHPVRVVAPWDECMGHAQAILIDPATGMRHGGADPRSDGLALGY
ncbi:MAG: gamma-glutamyltranspeptidase [Candidatus Tectimicrobiota bacterium]|nr:MAG: gamma-glutamyltranspeptidase [Candidatus Tectomicrobia bacterium]